ncbi:ribbon-helix-helix domain-containing protein [Afifella pfennigii]|uniref:ribbon-helix-helix domain-containing protein n=1 Tax=Afifella pfennigii TaxID=209897 RepID=UPI00047C83ED|nr:ribbon-helix-helix domain-containing protein [Afifella pfennigii]
MRKRSVVIAGHPTSVSLEEPFWEELKKMAAAQGKPVGRMIEEIDAARQGDNLSSAVRIAVLAYVKREAS